MNKFQKAKALADSGKVGFKGLIGSSLYFTVHSNEDHQVLFRIMGGKWLCDCRYSALHERDCSHILACKYWLKKNEKPSQKK